MESTPSGPSPDAPADDTPHTPPAEIDLHPSSSEIPSTDSQGRDRSTTPEERPPPLPPRPTTLTLLDDGGAPPRTPNPSQPALQSRATTAVSLTDIASQDAGKESYTVRSLPGTLKARASLSHLTSARGSEAGDTASIRSSVPHGDVGDVENVFGDFLSTESGLIRQHSSTGLLQFPEFQADDVEDDFASEFEPVGEIGEDGDQEEMVLEKWKAKRKHYLILSAAGKPIWTRHGDGGLISTYVGVIQTIISFYEDSKDQLRSFSAGDTKFVIVSKGPLYLVAISRFLESDTQLKLQLEALYMQILSTLTLPSLTHLFSVRPSTDLKRPLQGSETLLSTLADSFTRGSPPTLLSALECLKIRKSHRQTINNTLMKTRVSSLLYGLVVAGGRLVNVVRPKKHSLHPGDLQLLFNMVFEAEAVKAGGGESWIPVCLPGFNSSGYLYMYVSFLDLREDAGSAADDSTTKEESVAIVMISANKESFFELQGMRDAFVEQLEKNGSLKIIKDAVDKGRPKTTDIVPGTVLHHFLYKSRANVQFTMSSWDPDFSTVSRRRRLMSTYNNLHASIHAKHTHVKIHHCVSQSSSSFAWVTPIFEFYCVAGANANRNALAQSASKIIEWVHKEEERLFIIGGAVSSVAICLHLVDVLICRRIGFLSELFFLIYI
ncbi:vacuolar fusion protein mon1 [Aspergillus heteromorphus CBS 117.55]|uniref:Vacuolar fusion protein MON1 n=1 Tax=Aspergillus heteromorphus CBS 117.55 TaxID=1448321 RepID=A0A317VD72_9EURO|nr:vacuolar fusion protein mon1 [Aspergillus heteromorphus CBS 117.55]PWY70958.1 vacuolar fusion protein mon1 [Aspergillus heteromorphus CBS 117.55]